MELETETVQAYIRVRPPFDFEVRKPDYQKWIEIVERQNSVRLHYPRDTIREFTFDGVFNEKTNEDDVYDQAARPLVDCTLAGYSGTCFVYGQTGTGKTHTMGLLKKLNKRSQGIVPKTLRHLFSVIKPETGSVTLSIVQIYLEKIYDLLSPELKPLNLRQTNGEVFVQHMINVPIENYAQAVNLLNAGLENRVFAAQNMNQTSSRSHIILTLGITNKDEDKTIHSKLTLIDLAGSERVRKTSSTGQRLDEAKSINQSLSALGNVISSITNGNKSHIPFRSSTLTRLLQTSLSGDSKVVLIATVGPAFSNGGESLSTLQFASRCKEIVLMPQQEESIDEPINAPISVTLVEAMKREEALKARIEQLEAEGGSGNSSIFNHNQSEVATYLLRLLSKLTQCTIKYTTEMNDTRQQNYGENTEDVENFFEYLGASTISEDTREYFEDIPINILQQPSTTVIDKVQFIAKKLVENINILGKTSVQAQRIKAQVPPPVERAPVPVREDLLDVIDEVPNAMLLSSDSSNPLVDNVHRLISDPEPQEQPELQKVATLKELMSRQRSKQSVKRSAPVQKTSQEEPEIPPSQAILPQKLIPDSETVITVLYKGIPEELRTQSSLTLRQLREMSASIFGLADASKYVLMQNGTQLMDEEQSLEDVDLQGFVRLEEWVPIYEKPATVTLPKSRKPVQLTGKKASASVLKPTPVPKPSDFDVKVQLTGQPIVPIRTNLSETIGQIKRKFWEANGLEGEVEFQFAGKKLKDNSKVIDWNVIPGSRIQAQIIEDNLQPTQEPANPPPIRVKPVKNDKQTIKVQPREVQNENVVVKRDVSPTRVNNKKNNLRNQVAQLHTDPRRSKTPETVVPVKAVITRDTTPPPPKLIPEELKDNSSRDVNQPMQPSNKLPNRFGKGLVPAKKSIGLNDSGLDALIKEDNMFGSYENQSSDHDDFLSQLEKELAGIDLPLP